MPRRQGGYTNIRPEEAQRLIREESVRVLDVRTPAEYRDLGHIPGAVLLPVDVVVAGLATLPRDGRKLLVCCEHGIRSAAAARLLDQGGMPDILNLSGGMSVWRGEREFTSGDPFAMGPSSWLVLNADLLVPGGRVLDVACGSGRNALLLAAGGFVVQAADRDTGRIETLRETAARLGLNLDARILDLEADEVDLGDEEFETVLVFHYLHRPLFPALTRCLKPGGILLYETFTRAQALRGKPSNPAYLLEEGELKERIASLKVVREREGEFEGRMVAGVAAQRSSSSMPAPER